MQTTVASDRLIPETADAELLERPLRSVADIEAIERVPLDARLEVTDFCRRVDLALAARDPGEAAVSYVADGDVERVAATVSFGALRRDIARTADLLRAHGIGRTDAVAVLMPAVPSIYWSLLGAMSAGIAFPVNWMLEPEQILRLLREADAKAVIALGPTPGFTIWEALASIASELPASTPVWSVAAPGCEHLPGSDLDQRLASYEDKRPADDATAGDAIPGDAIAAYLHSGGTTGTPKIVTLSHRGLSYRHWTMQLGLRLSVGEVGLHDTPMFHAGGLIGRVMSALASGSSMLIPSILGARDRRYIANYWKFVDKYRVSRLSAVPTTLATLAKNPPRDEDLSSLKPYFLTGSTALPISVREEFQRISGVKVLNTYGMTENTASIAIDPRDGTPKEGSSGIRKPYTEVRAAVMDDAGGVVRLCGPDEIGMLQIKGPGVTPGYLNPAHERGTRTADGWFISGDLGRVDEDGYIFVTGRAKDVIIRGGHNIDPSLIEEPLARSPDVLLAAAVGKPDAYAGELPVVYVQLVPGSRATPATLADFLRDRIGERAAFPKDIVIVDKLPLSDVGKPLKTKLRQDAAERVFRSVVSVAADRHADGLLVSVQPHPTVGTAVNVAIACPAERREEVGARIRDAMAPFATHHTIEWRSPDRP